MSPEMHNLKVLLDDALSQIQRTNKTVDDLQFRCQLADITLFLFIALLTVIHTWGRQ